MGGPPGHRRRLFLAGGLQQHVGEPFDALAAVTEAAEPLRKGDPRQGVAPIDARHRAVGAHKEVGIRQASPQHPLVAAADHGRRFRPSIGHTKEPRQQHGASLQGQGVGRRVSAQQGHIALVGAHHGAEHLGRQGEEAGLDRPLDQLGGLHQIHQFLKQRFRQIGAPARFGGGQLQVLTDPGGTDRAIHLHVVGRQGGGVDAGISDGDRAALQAVATTEPVAAHGGIALAELHRHHLRIEQGHQPAHRPAEAALACPPAHEAAALQRPEPGGDEGGQQFHGCLTPLQAAGEHEGALLGLADLQLLGRHTAAAGEAQGRLRGLPLAESLLGRWALALTGAVLLALGHSLDRQGQPAWRTGATHGRAGQPESLQVGAHLLVQLTQGLPCEISRKLLRTDLQQKGGHGTPDAARDFMERCSQRRCCPRSLPTSEGDACHSLVSSCV